MIFRKTTFILKKLKSHLFTILVILFNFKAVRNHTLIFKAKYLIFIYQLSEIYCFKKKLKKILIFIKLY